MDGVGVGYLRGADNSRNIQVAFARCGRTDADGLIGLPDIFEIFVGLRIDDHGLDAQFVAGPDDPKGDFPPVGNQHS